METSQDSPDYDTGAVKVVNDYIKEHLDKIDPDYKYQVYIVWQYNTDKYKKWLMSTTIPDGMYYEVTYDYAKCVYQINPINP